MPNYNSAYTGTEIDESVEKYFDAKSNGGYVNASAILDLIYPVGSIYMSVNAVSPSTFIGGTWQAIEGKFLIGADSTYTSGSNGGSDKHTHTYAHTHEYAHTHTTPATTTESTAITVNQMPSHQHQLPFVANSISDSTSTDQYNFLYGKGQTASAMGQHTEMYNPDANREAEGNEYAYMTKTLGGGAGHTHGQKATTTNSQSTSTTSSQSTSTTSEVSNLPPYLAVYMWKRTA